MSQGNCEETKKVWEDNSLLNIKIFIIKML